MVLGYVDSIIYKPLFIHPYLSCIPTCSKFICHPKCINAALYKSTRVRVQAPHVSELNCYDMYIASTNVGSKGEGLISSTQILSSRKRLF